MGLASCALPCPVEDATRHASPERVAFVAALAYWHGPLVAWRPLAPRHPHTRGPSILVVRRQPPGALGGRRTTVTRDERGAMTHWYVSNVSIIFDAPCLFLHHLLSVLLHFVAFLWFSRTNLLTRCHSASSLFSVVFVFQKSYRGNILGIGQNKSRTSYYLMKLPEDRRGDGGGPQASHIVGQRG
jgi:hypothetical protein